MADATKTERFSTLDSETYTYQSDPETHESEWNDSNSDSDDNGPPPPPPPEDESSDYDTDHGKHPLRQETTKEKRSRRKRRREARENHAHCERNTRFRLTRSRFKLEQAQGKTFTVDELVKRALLEPVAQLDTPTAEDNNGYTLTKPQGKEVVRFEVKKTPLLHQDTFEIITYVDGVQKQRIPFPMKLCSNAFKGNTRGIIPSTALFLLELVQNAYDACAIGPPTGKYGDGMMSLTTTLLAKGIRLSYEVKRTDSRKLGVTVQHDGTCLCITNVSPTAITEDAWISGHSSKPKSNRDTQSLDNTIHKLSALVSKTGVPTTEQLYETTVILTPPSDMNTKEFRTWCDALVYRTDHTETCFLKWSKCAMFYRWTTSLSEPQVRMYHNDMLFFADKVPTNARKSKRGIDIRIVSLEPDRQPTSTRDRELKKGFLSRCAPERPKAGVQPCTTLSILIDFLLDVLKSSQGVLRCNKLHWSEELLELFAMSGTMQPSHIPEGLCIVNAHDSYLTQLRQTGCNIVLTYSCVSKFFDREKWALDYFHSKSKPDSEVTIVFRKEGEWVEKGMNVYKQAVRSMNVRRLLPEVNVYMLEYSWRSPKYDIRDKYIWYAQDNTLFVPHDWTAEKNKLFPVLNKFGLTQCERVMETLDKARHVRKATSWDIPLDVPTTGSWPDTLFPSDGPECDAFVMDITVLHDCLSPHVLRTINVADPRFKLSDPRLLVPLLAEIKKTSKHPRVSPFKMEGLYNQAILKRYASILEADIDAPLAFQTKVVAVVLLMLELTARPYGGHPWEDLKTFNCLPANCAVKSYLCVEVLNWLGLKTNYIWWSQYQHALVGITLGDHTYVIEATDPPLDIGQKYAMKCLLNLDDTAHVKTLVHEAWFKKMLAEVQEKHPGLQEFLSPLKAQAPSKPVRPMESAQFVVTVPPFVSAPTLFDVRIPSTVVPVQCPPNVRPGEQMTFTVQRPVQPAYPCAIPADMAGQVGQKRKACSIAPRKQLATKAARKHPPPYTSCSRPDVSHGMTSTKFRLELQSQFGLQAQEFDPVYDHVYTREETKMRGGEEYVSPPAGWKKVALNLDKYSDTDWLDKVNGWPVTYHGTVADKDVIRAIIQHGFKVTDVARNGRQYGDGVYFSPKLEYVVDRYCKGNIAGHKIVFLCRVRGSSIHKHSPKVWRCTSESDIRPVAILFK